MKERAGPASRTLLAGALGYAAVAAALTYPLLLTPVHGTISHWAVDLEHSLWAQWWFATALDSPELDLFSTNRIQFPNVVNLQLADFNLAICLAFYLVSKATGLVLAYNLLLWTSFVASGLLMWRLAARICGDEPAAWTAGLLFAASPYWLCSVLNAWVYLLHIWTLPLVLLAIARANAHRNALNFGLLGLCLGLVFHVSPYYFCFLLVLLLCLAPWHWRWFLRETGPRESLRLLSAAAVALLIVVLPRAIPMLAVSPDDFGSHHAGLDPELGAQISEMFFPSAAAVTDRAAEIGYLVVFLSYTLLATTLAGLCISRRRRAYFPWLFAGAAMLLLSMGPSAELRLFDTTLRLVLPDHWLHQLPGFEFMTNHWRWSLPGVFCAVVAFSLALADLCLALEHRYRFAAKGAVALVTACYLAEIAFVFPIPNEKPIWRLEPTPIALALRDAAEVEAVYDPRGRAKLNQLTHGKAIVGGWLPRLDRETAERTRELQRELHGRPLTDPWLVDRLGEIGVDAIVLSRDEAAILRPAPERPGHFELTPLTAQ